MFCNFFVRICNPLNYELNKETPYPLNQIQLCQAL